MSTRTVLSIVMLALAGTAVSGETPDVPAGLAGQEALFQRTIAREMFKLLPRDQQEKLREAGAEASEREPLVGSGILVLDERYEKVADVLSPEGYAVTNDRLLDSLVYIRESIESGKVVPQLCFAPGTPWETIEAFDLAYRVQQSRFQQTTRWSSTASGSTGGQGDPITLTYSFVPDGTFVPNLIGVSGNSQLFSWLNGIYGSSSTWQSLFAQVFTEWSDLIGVTYVYEPNDDGSSLNGASGSIGVRGDLRIAAISIDGNSGVLAYNNFPNDGDMVLDAFDSFFSATGSNSIRLRNVTAHEHGHGLGMLHVCPITQTKLMEPYYSGAFDGPQIDDILNGQRHYGDPQEPDDTAAQANNLGTIVVGTSTGTSNVVSIDDNSDQDLYRITTNGAVRVLAIAMPAADAYEQGTQTSACDSGTFTDYNAIHDLKLDLMASNGTTVLQTSDLGGLGSPEAGAFDVASAGTYYIRVRGGTTNGIQAYTLSVQGMSPPFIGPSVYVASAPTQLDPGVPTSFDVTVDPGQDTLTGTPELFYRLSGGSYLSVPLSALGGTNYEATLPAAACGDTPEFYVRAVGQTDGAVTWPTNAPTSVLSAVVGMPAYVLDDNFESATGWTVGGTITGGTTVGQWERGVPAGDGTRGDPSSDGDGSGQCYLTGNAAGNTDVDGGNTILTSAAFDLSGAPDADLSYWRWYDNTGSGTGSNPGVETFEVEISSTNGASWVPLESVGPSTSESSGGWYYKTFHVADYVTPSSVVRVRFIASDDVGAVIEAAVDGVKIGSFVCNDPASCECDLDGNNTLNIDDINSFAQAFVGGDLSVDFDNNGTLNIDDINTFAQCFVGGCP